MVEARFWTTGRSLRWIALLLLLVIGMPFVLGLTTGWLERTNPGRGWEDIGRATALTIFAIGLTLGAAWLWRDYRRHIAAAGGGGETWQRRATSRRLAISSVWRDCIIAGFVVGMACAFATQIAAGPGRIAMAIVAAIALAAGFIRSTVYYMRTIDEQERDANLWATYVALAVYTALFMAQYIAIKFAIVVPHVHEAIFLLTMAVACCVFLWKRFR